MIHTSKTTLAKANERNQVQMKRNANVENVPRNIIRFLFYAL